VQVYISNFETWMPCAGHLAHRFQKALGLERIFTRDHGTYVPLDVNLRAGITKGVI
jgi:hypothetical protein